MTDTSACPAVIFNADDFGYSGAVNEAVARAHKQGLLTSASLMVTGPAVDEAIALARQMPTLAVGLHLVMVDGRPVLPPGQIPHLVDRHGSFPSNAVRTGLHYALSRTARQELRQELNAQFERFAATGLPLSHVDSHLHMHMHPFIFGWLLPLAEQYGAAGLRIPCDELRLALDYDRHGAGIKVVWAIVFGLLRRHALPRLREHRLAVAGRVYGLMQSGRMQEAYVIRLLRRLQVPAAEVYFHPSCVADGRSHGPNPDDLTSLLSPAVRQVVRERNLRLATYATLARAETGHGPPDLARPRERS
jgi:hopanoid biosynthesis associated protein HpnK